MENQTTTEKYFIFGSAIIKGFKETVFLNKEGKLVQNLKQETLMLFNSPIEAFEYIKDNGLDLAEWDKLSNF